MLNLHEPNCLAVTAGLCCLCFALIPSRLLLLLHGMHVYECQPMAALTSSTPMAFNRCCRWRMPVEMALDLASLALYDIILYGESRRMRPGDSHTHLKGCQLQAAARR
jgi:hypothetical protein